MPVLLPSPAISQSQTSRWRWMMKIISTWFSSKISSTACSRRDFSSCNAQRTLMLPFVNRFIYFSANYHTYCFRHMFGIAYGKRNSLNSTSVLLCVACLISCLCVFRLFCVLLHCFHFAPSHFIRSALHVVLMCPDANVRLRTKTIISINPNVWLKTISRFHSPKSVMTAFKLIQFPSSDWFYNITSDALPKKNAAAHLKKATVAPELEARSTADERKKWILMRAQGTNVIWKHK